MASQNKAAVQLHAAAAKSYGLGLWDKKTLIAEGTMSNTVAKALKADVDPRTLKGPAMYYATSKFGDLQIIIKYEGEGWAYASILRDKEGEPVVSDTNEYEVHDVQARSEFKIPGVKNDKGEDVVIQKGFITTKAYAL
jgi:hypothetical protein